MRQRNELSTDAIQRDGNRRDLLKQSCSALQASTMICGLMLAHFFSDTSPA